MEIRTHRDAFTPHATFSSLTIDGDPFLCDVLERGKHMAEHPCIAPGRYELVRFETEKGYLSKHGPDTILVKDVPGRDLIEIHIANRWEQLLGCLAPGETRDLNAESIWESRVPHAALQAKVVAAWAAAERVWLTITEAGA